ncbi:UxaA family hydrolase [Pseudoduganella sp. RAF53_2]|uniref:UxaA family hydrolase n=1 Tax=unclassified Pseudoduganella TaxID=2637179 RepID=UPI003F94E012
MSQPSPLILLHPDDDVAICRTQVVGGAVVDGLAIRGLIPAGHKVARHDIAQGEPVRRYNQVIGFASRPIAAGEHVHTQNMTMGDFERDYAFGADMKPEPAPQKATFMGIRRPDGRVATRNYIGVLSSVNCSTTVGRAVADYFQRDGALADWPNIDGVVALSHGSGCAMDDQGLGLQVLQRTINGYSAHPNFAAVLVIGLGCEANQVSAMLAAGGLKEGETFKTFNIQDVGGTAKAVERGIEMVKGFLPSANAVRREPCSVEHITVGLQCGGSDGYSGISANPALGYAVDLLVAHGGTAILSETPEVYGAEHLLTRRAVSPEVGQKLVDRIHWWEEYVRLNQGNMNNNPSPGNKAGGLTTILEKSLGAVAKGGTTNMQAVYEYAEPVKAHGFVFMDTPGYDPVSATGQVAGGANLICFTTGRGSAYGCAPAPSLKLSTNSALWQRQADDIDINCGDIVDGTASIEEVGQRIFRQMLDTASGIRTKSEQHGYGQNEFVPWQLGAVM